MLTQTFPSPRHRGGVLGYTTGDLNAHDVVVDNSQKIIFINTNYSCLATLSDRHSFTAIWKPSFISQLTPEDR